MKQRFLLSHPESDALFEVYEDPNGHRGGYAYCDDVTGMEYWENKFKEDNGANSANNQQRDFMISKIALRKFFLAMASSFSELASEFDREDLDKTDKVEKKTTTKKETTTAKDKKTTTKKGKDDFEEVESPFNGNSDDPADFEDDGANGEEDDFAGMEEPKATVELLRAALVKYAQANTKEKAYAILAKFKAKKANEVAEKDLAKAIAALKV